MSTPNQINQSTNQQTRGISCFLGNEIPGWMVKKYEKNRHISLAALKQKQKTPTLTNFLKSTALNPLSFSEDSEFGMMCVSTFCFWVGAYCFWVQLYSNWSASTILGKSVLNVSVLRCVSSTSVYSRCNWHKDSRWHTLHRLPVRYHF